MRLPESYAGPRLIVRQTLIIKVHTDEGIVGITEAIRVADMAEDRGLK